MFHRRALYFIMEFITKETKKRLYLIRLDVFGLPKSIQCIL